MKHEAGRFFPVKSMVLVVGLTAGLALLSSCRREEIGTTQGEAAANWTRAGSGEIESVLDDCFKGREVTDSGMTLQFHDRGIRYLILSDGEDKSGRVSGYGEKILLPEGGRLTLVDKHFSLKIALTKERPRSLLLVKTADQRSAGGERSTRVLASVIGEGGKVDPLEENAARELARAAGIEVP